MVELLELSSNKESFMIYFTHALAMTGNLQNT